MMTPARKAFGLLPSCSLVRPAASAHCAHDPQASVLAGTCRWQCASLSSAVRLAGSDLMTWQEDATVENVNMRLSMSLLFSRIFRPERAAPWLRAPALQTGAERRTSRVGSFRQALQAHLPQAHEVCVAVVEAPSCTSRTLFLTSASEF